jgi:hypothetical protein
MKKPFFVIALFLAALSLHAAVTSGMQAPRRVLEQALIAFDSGEYGKALVLAEQARRRKKTEYDRYTQILVKAMTPRQVQNVGDDIIAVLDVLLSREEYDAAALITFFVDIKSLDFFHRRVSEIIDYLKKTAVFPEAEFLIGNVYRYEGELDLARQYYLRSWEQAYALDIPGQKYDILYQIADLGEMLGDDELFEQSLLLVLADDSYYNDAEGLMLASLATGVEVGSSFYDSLLSALKRKYTPDKIFEMYRSREYRSLRAYVSLAEFYRAGGSTGGAGSAGTGSAGNASGGGGSTGGADADAGSTGGASGGSAGADAKFLKTAALGSLTAFTRMYEALAAREPGYEWRGTADFFRASLRHRGIVEWSLDQSVWDCFYYFAEAALRAGMDGFAQELFALLAEVSPDPGVRSKARLAANR